MRARLVLSIAIASLVVGAIGVTTARRERSVQRARTILPADGGLREGADVHYAGILVGAVTRIVVDPTGIAVDLALSDTVPLRTADSVAVVTLGRTGDRAICITPGPATAPLLPAHGVLPFRPARPEILPEELIERRRVPPPTWYWRVRASGDTPVTHNEPLQLSGAVFKEAIAIRPLQVQQQRARSRALKSTACS